VKRPLWIALAVIVFAAILVARLPAAWIIPAGRGDARCAGLEGSLWNGACTGLTVHGTPVGDLSWELRPLRLAVGKLAAHVTLTEGAGNATADVELGLGELVTARHVLADFPLDPKLVPGLPPALQGHAHVDLTLLQIQRGIVTQLQGRIEAHDLQERSGVNTPLGSYVATFPGGSGDPIGEIRDLDGPLALQGKLRLTRQPGFELEGLIAARSGAPPELVNNLRFLGSPDASGRRTFSLSGTF
jgi:general secretion pathway protein N